jgi:hypothetical protein
MFHVEQSRCGTPVEKLWGMFHVEHLGFQQSHRGRAKAAMEVGGAGWAGLVLLEGEEAAGGVGDGEGLGR